MVVAAVIGGGLALGGAVLTSNAASDAADSAERAARMGVDEQRAAREQAERIMKPYVDAGAEALVPFKSSLGLGSREDFDKAFSMFKDSPDYKFAFDEGMRAVMASSKATGLGTRGSGAVDALQKRGMGLATQNLTNWRAALSDLMGSGRSSAGYVADVGTSTARGISDTLNQGAARASAYRMDGAKAYSDALSDAGSLAAYAYGYDRGYR